VLKSKLLRLGIELPGCDCRKADTGFTYLLTANKPNGSTQSATLHSAASAMRCEGVDVAKSVSACARATSSSHEQ
jgi:hypothetical protein